MAWFYANQNVPQPVVTELRAKGDDVIAIRETRNGDGLWRMGRCWSSRPGMPAQSSLSREKLTGVSRALVLGICTLVSIAVDNFWLLTGS